MNGKELRELARIVDEECGKGKSNYGFSIDETCQLVKLYAVRPQRLKTLRRMGKLKDYLNDETYREAWEKNTELYVKYSIAGGDMLKFKDEYPDSQFVDTAKLREANEVLLARIKEIKENEIKKIQEELNQLEEGF